MPFIFLNPLIHLGDLLQTLGDLKLQPTLQEQRRRRQKAFSVLRQRRLLLLRERRAHEAGEEGGGGGQVAAQEPRGTAQSGQHVLHERRAAVVEVGL